jgi:hypothetical protein
MLMDEYFLFENIFFFLELGKFEEYNEDVLKTRKKF